MGGDKEGNKKWSLSKGDVIELDKYEKELERHEEFAKEELNVEDDQNIPYEKIKEKNEAEK